MMKKLGEEIKVPPKRGHSWGGALESRRSIAINIIGNNCYYYIREL
jgi:hypothetical protein